MEDEHYNTEGESSDEEDNTFSIISEEPIPSCTFFVESPLFQHKASAHTAWGLPAIDPFEFRTHTAPRYSEVPFDEQSFNGLHSFQTSNVRTLLFLLMNSTQTMLLCRSTTPMTRSTGRRFIHMWSNFEAPSSRIFTRSAIWTVSLETLINSYASHHPSTTHDSRSTPTEFTAWKGIPPTGSGIYTASVLKPTPS